MAEYEYKKITKEYIDFPRYCYFFISEIQDSIDENSIKDVGDEIEIEIETTGHPYCYDALELIVRSFVRKGFDTRIPNYRMEKNNVERKYIYKWKLVKTPNIDDLPF